MDMIHCFVFLISSKLNVLHHYSQYHISTCSSTKCGFTISINRPSVQGEFFDETVEYKWWVWVLDWWALIIMHISPSLKRACTPPGQTAVACCPQQVFIPLQFKHLSSEYLATQRIFYNREEIKFFSCDAAVLCKVVEFSVLLKGQLSQRQSSKTNMWRPPPPP